MEVVTDKNVLDSIKKLKLEKEYNIKEGDIVNDPKILDAIKLQKEKRLKKDETPNFFEKWVLGEGRTQYPDF